MKHHILIADWSSLPLPIPKRHAFGEHYSRSECSYFWNDNLNAVTYNPDFSTTYSGFPAISVHFLGAEPWNRVC